MQQELQAKVLTVAKKASKTIDQSGVEPSLTEDDMKDYLERVIEEIQLKKQNTS